MKKFKTWLYKFCKLIRLDVNDKFNEVFEDINGLQLTTKRPQSDEDKRILEFIAKYDDKTGYELKDDSHTNYQLSEETGVIYTSITELENKKKAQEKVISQNKRLLEDLRGARGDNAEGQKQVAINAKIVAETALEEEITPELTRLKAIVDKNKTDAKAVLDSIKTEYKKALAKIEEKYKDKKDEKVKDTGTKTPLNLAKKDDVEEIDKIFGEKIEEINLVLEPRVKSELNDALHKVIVGEFSGGQVGGMMGLSKDFTKEEISDTLTQSTEGQNLLTFNGKKLESLFSVGDIKTNIEKIRAGYSSITGDKPSLQKIIEILNQYIPVEYVINDGLKIFVYWIIYKKNLPKK